VDEQSDVLVIGAGLGGLAAGVAAAGRGRRVRVLESGGSPGGYAQCFYRGPYRFETSLHALNGLAPGGGMDTIYRELGIWDRVRLQRLDPLYVARFPDQEVVAHADVYRYESDLIGQFSDEAAGIRGYLDEASAVYRDAARVYEDQVAGRRASLEDYLTRYPSLVAVSAETWSETIRRHTTNPRLVAVLGALWSYAGLPPEQVASLAGTIMAMSYAHHGGWYPEGGSGALASALEQELRARGGEVSYSQTVTDIEVRDGRAVGVETAEGLRIAADTIVSDASAPATMLELVGREHLPVDYVERVEAPGASYTFFNVYLGLERDVFEEQGLAHELFVSPDYDPLAERQASLAGDWSHSGIAVTDYTRVDPGCAPRGGGVVVISAIAGWDFADVWGTSGDLSDYHSNPAYLAVKERVADELVRLADDAVPGLAAAVGHRETSSPLTNFAYTHNPFGAIEGYENTPANTGVGWLPQTTPISNLFLAGAWTNGGGQNPAIQSGKTAVELALAAGE